jgi:hypothetical protein
LAQKNESKNREDGYKNNIADGKAKQFEFRKIMAQPLFNFGVIFFKCFDK